MNQRAIKYVLFALFGISAMAKAQVTFTGNSSDDAFLATGSPSNPKGTNLTGLNFGMGGVLFQRQMA